MKHVHKVISKEYQLYHFSDSDVALRLIQFKEQKFDSIDDVFEIFTRVGQLWQLEIPHGVPNVACQDEFFCIFSFSFPTTFEYPTSRKPIFWYFVDFGYIVFGSKSRNENLVIVLDSNDIFHHTCRSWRSWKVILVVKMVKN